MKIRIVDKKQPIVRLSLKPKSKRERTEADEKGQTSKGALLAREYFKNKIHYGHKPSLLNPKMIPYLYRGRIIRKGEKLHHEINIRLTNYLLNKARELVEKETKKGKIFLFVGTKFHLKHIVAKQASRCNQYYVNYRWLGGMLTNWSTIQKQIKKFKDLKEQQDNGSLENLPIKEYNKALKELSRLEKSLIGIQDMPRIPDVVIITHQLQEINAVRECKKLGLLVISILDTDCDPDLVDYVIPANDDSTVSVDYLLDKLADSILNISEKN